jgi:uncharacterized membrane protein YozB (DUF420 family)
LDLSFLPAVNATLNATAGVLLVAGVMQIKKKKIEAHRNTMLAAFATSSLFLVLYVTHYIWRVSTTLKAHTPFNGPEPFKTLYHLMLFSHILLAMTVPVFAIWLIRLGLARRDAAHRRVAKIAFPIWLYVSITGVLIYVILYHLFPPMPV